jgi:hypothetical protein
MSGLQPLAQSLQPLIDKSKYSPALTNQHQATYAAERARLLFGQFRKGDANDPQTYTASITAVLSRYPADIMREVTDPRTGLASRLDWLPTVKEVHDACETIEQPRRHAAQREIELRRQREDLAKFEEARKAAPSLEDLKAKHGPSWGLSVAESETPEAQQKRREALERANRVLFDRECAAAGVDPSKGVSPALIALVRDQTQKRSEA